MSSDDESEGEIDVFDFGATESNIKSINSVAPNKFLDNSASLQPLRVDFDAESLQKKYEKNGNFTSSLYSCNVEWT